MNILNMIFFTETLDWEFAITVLLEIGIIQGKSKYVATDHLGNGFVGNSEKQFHGLPYSKAVIKDLHVYLQTENYWKS